MATPKFRVTKHPTAVKAKRYRYSIVAGNGQTLQSGEGYPTHQHVTRAIAGIFNGFAKLFGVGSVKGGIAAAIGNTPAIPYTADSLKPEERAPRAKKAKLAT